MSTVLYYRRDQDKPGSALILSRLSCFVLLS
jgi:hypothetical protein